MLDLIMSQPAGPAPAALAGIMQGIVLGLALSPVAVYLARRPKAARPVRPQPIEVLPPPKAQAAPGADPMTRFLTECCIMARAQRASAADLRAAYQAWCDAAGVEPKSDTAFGRALTAMGFGRRKSHGAIVRTGITLRPEWAA